VSTGADSTRTTTNTTGSAESNAADRGKTNESDKAGDGSVSPSDSRRLKSPVLGDLPGPLFRSNSTTNSLRRERIKSKLHRTILPELVFDNAPLPEALRQLSEQAARHDPEGQGVDFLLNPNVPERLDMNTVVVRLNPPLRNVRLGDAIEAIVKTADKPIRYSIEDYAVVFSPKP